MKLAILCSRFPFPLDRGDKLRMYHQVKHLANYHEIYLFAISSEQVTNEDIKRLMPFCKKICIHKSTFLDKFIGIFTALYKGWPLQVGILYSSKFKGQVAKVIADEKVDAIYCQLIRMVPFCIDIHLPKAIDYMDAFGVSMKRRSNISRFPLKWIYDLESKSVCKYEQKVISQFDQAFFITHHDAKLVDLPDNEDQKIRIISNGIDLTYFQNSGHQIPGYDIGFIGNLGYLPNEEAIKYLCQKILPAYEIKYGKKLNVLIGGARPGGEVLKLKSQNVDIVSWYEDIRHAYKEINILCAPIFNGTGQQNKILEAMAMGVAVVCSKEVKAGIDSEAMLVCSEVDEFVDAIHKLLTDDTLRQKLVSMGKLYLENRYEWSEVVQDLNDSLSRLA